MKRMIRRLFKLCVASALLDGLIYAGTDSFSQKWRDFIVGQLEERGLYLDFEGLMINPFGGLIARDVKIYRTSERKNMLVSVDRLNLEFDYGKLMEKMFVVDGLELNHANVTLPVDDEAGGQTTIKLEDFSARAFLRDGLLELRKAEGILSGIGLSITGELRLPEKKQDKPDEPKPDKLSLDKQLQVISSHHRRIQKGLDWLQRFDFTTRPQIRLEVKGDVERPIELSARLFFEAAGLRYGSYVCEDLVAEAEFDAGLIDLTRLYLKDSTGQVNASATWRMGTPELNFQFTSSADLPSVAQAFLNNDNLREIVFYGTPHLALSGTWYVDGPQAAGKRPVHATGSLDCGRFSTRGAVFDGLKANIGVSPEGVYIRDLLLKHESGTLAAQALSHEKEGFHYRAVLRMDPNTFLPFAKMKQTRELISRFQLNPSSSVYLELEGKGPRPDLQACVNKGRADLRNLRYRGVDLVQVEADLEFQGPVMHFRNGRIRRKEGVGEVAHVHVNDTEGEKWVRLEKIRAGLDPAAITSCFAPKAAEQIAKYHLPSTTTVAMDGIIYYKDGARSDFEVQFRHPTGTGKYMLWGEDHLISAPNGELKFKGFDLNFDINGRLFGESLNAKGTVDLQPGVDAFSVVVKAGSFPYEVFSKPMPFTGVTATVRNQGGGSSFDIKSSLLGGSFSLVGKLEEGRQNAPYSGELKLEGVSLPRLARLYSKTNDAEGDVTGHFRFAGRMNNWMALKGGGAVGIVNGDLYAVPILGPLTPLLGSVLPNQIKGYNVAKEADCTFEVADGYVMTKDFEALTSVFKIAMDGKIDFIRDAVDITAQVRIRGLPGLVFLPFSELLEYRGTGSISDTKWKSNLLSGGRKSGERAPPSSQNMRDAERIADEALPKKKTEPRRPGSLFNLPFSR